MGTASWNTIGAITTTGEIFIGGITNVFSSVCLGNFTRTKERWTTTMMVPDLLGNKIIGIYSGPNHFCAITEDHQLITWGVNINLMEENSKISGQLGHTDAIISTPQYINRSDEWDKIIMVACGMNHTVLLTTNGVYCFGSNNYSQCTGTSNPLQIPKYINKSLFIDNNGIQNIIKHIACGSHFTLALTANGRVWGWGSNLFGQLGYSKKLEGDVIATPKLIISPLLEHKSIVNISCGANHSLFLSNKGDLFSLGSNLFGQLGIGDPSIQYTSNVHFISYLSDIMIWNVCIFLSFSLFLFSLFLSL